MNGFQSWTEAFETSYLSTVLSKKLQSRNTIPRAHSGCFNNMTVLLDLNSTNALSCQQIIYTIPISHTHIYIDIFFKTIFKILLLKTPKVLSCSKVTVTITK